MSPLVTILVIMLLTVVYNESQFVADYQDVYQKVFKKNSMPLESCDSVSQRKICEISLYKWRQFLKENDVADYDDEDVIKNHDFINDDTSRNMGQKRNYIQNNVMSKDNCETVKIPIELGEGYFPKMISNISCDHTSGETETGHRICLRGSNCQPVAYRTRVLKRRARGDTVHNDIPLELKACWKFEEITIHVGCKCARTH